MPDLDLGIGDPGRFRPGGYPGCADRRGQGRQYGAALVLGARTFGWVEVSNGAVPQAIKVTDALGGSCLYVPITQDGRVVDSLGQPLDLEDCE